MGGIGVSTNQ